jgi:DNA-binding transcriptional MocR family regulator
MGELGQPRTGGADAGRYDSVYGLRALRRQLTAGLAQRAIECSEEQIVRTQGASQALEPGSVFSRYLLT